MPKFRRISHVSPMPLHWKMLLTMHRVVRQCCRLAQPVFSFTCPVNGLILCRSTSHSNLSLTHTHSQRSHPSLLSSICLSPQLNSCHSTLAAFFNKSLTLYVYYFPNSLNIPSLSHFILTAANTALLAIAGIGSTEQRILQTSITCASSFYQILFLYLYMRSPIFRCGLHSFCPNVHIKMTFLCLKIDKPERRGRGWESISMST